MWTVWLAVAIAQDPGWSKPEGELPWEVDRPVVSCCGFDRDGWRRMLDPLRPDLAACAPADLEAPLKVRVRLEVPANTTTVVPVVETDDPALTACMVAVLGRARYPGSPLPCTFVLNWPVTLARPSAEPDDGE